MLSRGNLNLQCWSLHCNFQHLKWFSYIIHAISQRGILGWWGLVKWLVQTYVRVSSEVDVLRCWCYLLSRTMHDVAKQMQKRWFCSDRERCNPDDHSSTYISDYFTFLNSSSLSLGANTFRTVVNPSPVMFAAFMTVCYDPFSLFFDLELLFGNIKGEYEELWLVLGEK